MLTAQMEQEVLDIVAPRHYSGKRIECNTAYEDQDVKRSVPSSINVASCTKEKRIISKNQIVLIAKEASRFMFATKESTEEIFGATETFKDGTNRCHKISNKIQELSFPDVDAKY